MKKRVKKKTKSRQHKFDACFLLGWKRILGVVVIWFLAAFAHNAVYGLLGVEEIVFFSLAIFIIPGYLIFAVVYTLIKRHKKIEEDL